MTGAPRLSEASSELSMASALPEDAASGREVMAIWAWPPREAGLATEGGPAYLTVDGLPSLRVTAVIKLKFL